MITCEDLPGSTSQSHSLTLRILFSCKMLTNPKESSVLCLITLSFLYHLVELQSVVGTVICLVILLQD